MEHLNCDFVRFVTKVRKTVSDQAKKYYFVQQNMYVPHKAHFKDHLYIFQIIQTLS